MVHSAAPIPKRTLPGPNSARVAASMASTTGCRVTGLAIPTRTVVRWVHARAAPAMAKSERNPLLSGMDTSSNPRRSASSTRAKVCLALSSLESESPNPRKDVMWISSVPYQVAEGELQASYQRQARRLGEPTEVTLAGSLYPPMVAARLDLYAVTARCPSKLTPHQRNLISFVTSALNGTVHCMSQVTIKLRETGMDNDHILTLAQDPLSVELPPADAELVRYTVKLTSDPSSVREDDIDRLRAVGFDDLDILDANSQCAHLNYVNRVASGLGITSLFDPDFPAYDAIPERPPAAR